MKAELYKCRLEMEAVKTSRKSISLRGNSVSIVNQSSTQIIYLNELRIEPKDSITIEAPSGGIWDGQQTYYLKSDDGQPMDAVVSYIIPEGA